MSDLTPLSDNHELQIKITKDVLGTLIGIRSAWIDAEENCPTLDQAKIDAWKKERGEYVHLRKRLPLMEEAEVVELLKTCDAKVVSERAAVPAGSGSRGT